MFFKAIIIVMLLLPTGPKKTEYVHNKDFSTLAECSAELEKGKVAFTEAAQAQFPGVEFKIDGKCAEDKGNPA